MANFKNTLFYLVTGAQTVPANIAGTGTIVTLGTAVQGTGTKFKSEMAVGSWLVSQSANEIRKIKSVESDTLAYMEQALSVDLGSSTPAIIPADKAKPVTISVSVPAGLTAGTVDNVALAAGTGLTFSKDSRDHSAARDIVDPILVNGTSTTMQVLIQY